MGRLPERIIVTVWSRSQACAGESVTVAFPRPAACRAKAAASAFDERRAGGPQASGQRAVRGGCAGRGQLAADVIAAALTGHVRACRQPDDRVRALRRRDHERLAQKADQLAAEAAARAPDADKVIGYEATLLLQATENALRNALPLNSM